MPETRLLCRAIERRCTVRFFYEGTTASEREVEPHIVGHSAEGQVILSGWQLTGGSGQGWRNYHVGALSGLEVTEHGFGGPRPDYNPDDATFASVICRL